MGRIIFFVLVYWYVPLTNPAYILTTTNHMHHHRVCGLRPQAGPFFIFMGISWLAVIVSVAMG